MKYPALVLEVAVEPRRSEDRERLVTALLKLSERSADFSFSVDHESGQMILRGPGEAELEALGVRLKSEFGVQMNVGAPQVAYRETITRTVLGDNTFKRREPYGFAKVKIKFEPLPPGTGFVFQNLADETAVPAEYLPGVTKGLFAAARSGAMAGFPVIDFKATLLDGAQHPVDSSIMAFDLATRACFREAIPKAGPKILEPIMKVEVSTPEKYLGEVIGDLNLRRGHVVEMDQRDDTQAVTALVPLANMFGYSNTLRSMTDGRATFAMRFLRHEPVPNQTPDDDFPMAAALRP